MYLKSIELYGFKSFAERTKIDLDENITCIVGPNGSGKSNITDAIRWVLGEQSTLTLRGNKMSDVIFAGTDHRRALGMAEVIVTFDNESRNLDLDYNTVEVKRRYYKNGDSEYYINNNQCRLKDVRELFMDTGIGRDGYSIIGQGRIDAILNSRPSERRSIFEEAAGISKFKAQKQDTERKLEKTKENLIRLQDLLFEIENQKDSLKIEAEKAEKYNQLYYRILKADINNLSIELVDLEKNIEELKARKIKQVSYKDQVSQKLKELKNQYEQDRAKVEEIEDKINQLQLENIENVRLEKDLYNQISLGQERKANKEKENTKLALRKDIKTEDLLGLDLEIDNTKNTLNKINLQIKDLEKEEESLSNSIDLEKQGFSTRKENLDKITENISFLSEELSKNKVKIDTLSNLNQERENNKAQIKNDFLKSDENRQNLDKTYSQLDKKVQTLKNDLQIKTSKLKAAQDEKDQKSNIIENINKESNKLTGLINNQELKLNTLRNMEENYEGYNKSIRDFFRYLKNNKLKINELHDTVANLIKIPVEYEKAITTALAGASQNLVVDKYEDAQKIIALLRKKNLGRITFLPLDTISPYKKRIDVDRSLYIDLASNLVSYDPAYEKIIKFLLENIIITKDLTDAKKIFSSGLTNIRIVSLDGDVLNPGGSVSGGSTSWTGNIFNRKNELEKVEKDLKELNLDLKNLKEKELLLKDELTVQEYKVKNLMAEKSCLENDLEEVQRDFIQVKLKLDSSNKNISDINNSLDKLNTLILESEKEIKALNSQQGKIYQEISNLEEEKKLNSIEISKLDQEKVKLETEKNNINIKLNNLKNENTFTNKSYERLLGERNRLEEEIESINKNLLENESFLCELTKQIEKWKAELEEISLVNKSFDSNFKNFNEQRKSQKTKLDQGIKNINDNKELVLEVDKDLYVIDSDLENNYDKKANIYNYVAENYNFSFYDFNFQEIVIEKILSKSKVKQLKQDLAALGDINLGAIKSFKEAKERYDFTKTQYDDLSTSEEKLKKLLKDIEKTMEEKFTQSFEEINKNFNRIFNYLFEGGKANLILVEDENPIDSGIDIVAQLPGKKKQLLSAMSGGERSLTTVALLFALLETRPAPFCLLDEVDAALDDANIKRFLSYLKNLNNIQFAIVTHRKTTMAAADYIYGVTMEETGVSKIISLKFKGGK